MTLPQSSVTVPPETAPAHSSSTLQEPGIPADLTVTAFDLDRTLIYSVASMGDPAVLPPLKIVEYFEGEVLSRMTSASWSLLTELMQVAEVVPVTTRTRAQYERVALPRTPKYAICANGGVLLVDGVRDPEWDEWVRGIVALSAPLVEVLAVFDEVAEEAWVKKAKAAEGLFCYLVANSRKEIPGKWLRKFTERVTAMGWTVSVQGRKVYAVPEGLSKASGLMRLRSILVGSHPAEVRVYSTGDSLLDAPMLEASDAAIRPAHGELHEQGWGADGVEVTSANGALAGEEIVEWMLGRAQQP